MADNKLYFGKCTCCLNYGYIWPMWEQHVIEEEPEIYGQMLIQCFDISTDKDNDQICEDCVWKLREAYLFKKQVQRCQEEMKHCDVEVVIKPELDNENYIVEYLEEDVLDSFELEEHVDSEGTESGDVLSTVPVGEESVDEKESDASEFEDYEELDEGEETQSPSAAAVRKRAARRPAARRPAASTDDDSDNKPKWPRKLPKEERYKTYKQYPEEALKSAVAAVMSKRMNQTDAANRYKVPKKTLGAKLRDIKNNKTIFPSKTSPQLVNELATLLRHINATPFRCRANSALCFYCPQSPFSTAAEFRAHNTNKHSTPTRKILDAAMRPLYNNEIVKLDLKDLTCNICEIALLNWLDALQHLETIHDVNLQCKNKMIPFVLDDNLCVICAEEFSSFMLLHAHMNKHYSNYVCGVCGDPFISVNRLKTHQKIHDTGEFPCPVCNKVFTRDVYMRKHVVTHTEEMKVKCHHCDEIFKTEHQRQAHKTQSHREFVESITCELCGKTFHWMRLFLRHMKRKHGTEYHCEECAKFFESKADLKEHKLKHMGAKEFKCLVCCKKFFSRTSLNSHFKCSHQNIDVD